MMFAGLRARPQIHDVRQCWARSKVYRAFLVAALLFALVRLAFQGALILGALMPGDTPAPIPEEERIPNDLGDYLDAARRLQNREDLYLKGRLDRVEFYQYAPAYALAFAPFLWMSPVAAAAIHTLLHVGAYALLYFLWGRIFYRLGLERAAEMLAWTLPVWVVCSAFWGDLSYLNIYVIMALLGTLLIDAVLDERLGWSLLWLSIILQIKPQWAFAAAVPLLLGRWRFFARLAALAIVSYAAIVGVTMLVAGPEYGWAQYVDYARFLVPMPGNFPWREPGAPFLGYNHSIMQVVMYTLGVSPGTFTLATAIKLALLLPLGVVSARQLLRPASRAGRDTPLLALDLAFVLYLGAFIWLDMVWELSLGAALFPYLLATLDRRDVKIGVAVIFLLYALVDVWRLVSFIVFGDAVIAPGLYVLTDPSVYLPLTMMVILAFYAALLARLWAAPARSERLADTGDALSL